MAHAIFTASLPRRGRRAFLFHAAFALGLSRLAVRHSRWCRRRRDRRWLQQLDARALRNLGLNQHLVDGESAIAFWRLH